MSLRSVATLQLLFIGALLSVSSGAPECNAPVDVIFLVDSSTSVGESDFRQNLGWLADLIGQFQVGGASENEAGARFGVVVYSRKVETLVGLNETAKSDELRETLKSAEYLGESSHVHSALLEVYHQNMFASQSGGRPGAKDVVVIISDGKASYPLEALFAAQVLKSREVTVMTAGLTPEIELATLRKLASSWADVFALQEGEDETGRERIKSELAQRVCEVAMDQN